MKIVLRLALLLSIVLISDQSSTARPLAGGAGGDLSVPLFYPALSHPFRFTGDTVSVPLNDSVPEINKGRLAIIGGVMLGSFVTIHLYQQSGWWKDNRAPFHFQEDLVYGLNVDKFGHFFGAYLLNYTISKSAEWADLPEREALWIGAAGALLFQTYVEVEDGYSTWGFDRVDFTADVLGAAWTPLRYYIPAFRAVDVKFSYHPSNLLGNPGGVGFKGQKHLLIDDYEGQTIWFSLKMRSVLPEPVTSWWPGFLNLAFGYGVREVAGPHPFHVYYLAPDLDMTKIIPTSTLFLTRLGEILNFIHFPLPAIEIYPNTTFYGIYF